MATCGNCKKSHQTVEHVRECYAKRTRVPVSDFALRYVESRDFMPMALAPDIDSGGSDV